MAQSREDYQCLLQTVSTSAIWYWHLKELLKRRVEQGFLDDGNYMEDKKNIGLGN